MSKFASPGLTVGDGGIVVVVVVVVVDVVVVDGLAIVVETRGMAACPTGADVVLGAKVVVVGATVVVGAAVVVGATVVVGAAVVVGATVVVVVVVDVEVVLDVGGATVVVEEDVDGAKLFVTHGAAPLPPEHCCQPLLDVQFASPLANSGLRSN